MGKIELDHTGTGGGITLSSDGTDLLLDGTAIGGGGGTALELYAENPVTPVAPSATGTNAVAIGDGSVASGFNSLSFGKDSDATQANNIAIGRLSQSTGTNGALAIGFYASASGERSISVGSGTSALSSVSAGLGSVAIGNSYASGADSFAAAIANNTATYGATGANSVAIGYQAKATATGAMAFGDRNTASGEDAVVFGESNTGSGPWSFTAGRSNVNSGSRGVALGNAHTVSSFYTTALGSSNTASQNYCTAIGSNSLADKQGKLAHASLGFGTDGDAQYGRMVLAKATTDATPVALTSIAGNPASDINQIILPNNSAYFFSGTIVARQDAASGTDLGAWEIKGAIRREGSAATTTLVKSTIDDFNVPAGWVVALSADTTNGGLAITVTGAAATNIRWVATVNTSEVTY